MIGIIALLISILMPVLGKARQQANAVRCMTNLRTLSQAWLMYAHLNQRSSAPGRLPTSHSPIASEPGAFHVDNGTQYRPRWYELLGAVVNQYACKNPKAIEDDSWTIENPSFLCPTVPEWTNSRNYPYGYNHQFLGNPRSRPDGKWVNWPVKADRVRSAETVMAADSMGTAAGKPKRERLLYHADGSKDLYGLANKGFLLDPPRLTSSSDYADPQNRSPENRSGPDPRHGGRANVSFCDGHVEGMMPGEMGYVMAGDGSMPASGAGAHNRLFSGTGRDEDPPPVN